MSNQATQNNTPALSEKARRLLAAHDREVSQFHMERAQTVEGYTQNMNG